MKCDHCGEETKTTKFRYYTGGLKDVVKDTILLPFTCKRCGGSFCSNCRLPENHDCPALPISRKVQGWRTPSKNSVILDIKPDVLEPNQHRKPKRTGRIGRYYSWNHPWKKIRYTPGDVLKDLLKRMPIMVLLFIIYMFITAT